MNKMEKEKIPVEKHFYEQIFFLIFLLALLFLLYNYY
jgi:hypothetical protein